MTKYIITIIIKNNQLWKSQMWEMKLQFWDTKPQLWEIVTITRYHNYKNCHIDIYRCNCDKVVNMINNVAIVRNKVAMVRHKVTIISNSHSYEKTSHNSKTQIGSNLKLQS